MMGILGRHNNKRQADDDGQGGAGDELLETVDLEEQLDSGNVASLKGSTA